MDAETIGLIIKWGPLALVGLVFLWYFICGVAKGTYKVMRRLIYVILYIVFIWIFIDKITNFALDFNVTINGVQGVRNFIINFIESNEDINKFFSYSPDLKALFVEHPEIIVSPILFIVLLLVGLPLSFPVYWIYLILWSIFAKHVLKREKYKKDDDGNIIRNEKGKKEKVYRRKRRLLGGLIYGVQGVALICVVLMPVNFVNRIYNKAKNTASLSNDETLCSSFEGTVEIDGQICEYLEIYNDTIFAKLGGEKSIDRLLSDSLTSVKIDGEKVKLEKELSNVAVSAVLLNESGLLSLLINGEVNLDTLDLSLIDFDKINLMIDTLFSSYTISRLSEAGVRYVLNEVLNDKLVEVLKDDDIVSKLEYEDSVQIKEELKNMVNIIKYAVENNMDNLVIDNRDNVVNIVNGIDNGQLETLLNKILSLRIINNAMPSAIKAYGEEYGVTAPENMTVELNGEITKTFVNAVKFVKTMELTKLEDITEGNLVDNLANSLFEEGALKDASKDSLATLLNDINSSYLFKNVISSQVNKLLEDKDYKVDARVLKYVTNKEAWLNELDVLDDAYAIYDEFNDTEVVNYGKVTDLLNDISGTKVFISILPFAYQELLPSVGIEIDSEGLPVIDFDGENEDESKKRFYDVWEYELILLKNIADSIEFLELQSFDEIDVGLLNDEDNVNALSKALANIYSSDLLREPIVELVVDKVNEFVVDYEVEFSNEELLSINTEAKWKNELTNINKVLNVDFSDENNINRTNLETIFTAVGSMELFNNKKVEILKYAIRESSFLTTEEYESISWPDGSDQNEINAFWNNETSVLLDIVDKRETIETITTNLDLKTLDTDEIGNLLNRVMDSNILNNIVTNKVAELFIDNDLKDDRDVGESTTNLKNSISTVSDWKVELVSIKEMLNITEDNMGDKESGETKNRAEKIFDSIETSELLSNTRANLLLKAIETIDITEIPEDITVDTLKNNNYEKYNAEKNIFIEISKNKKTFDAFSSMTLETIDTAEVGSLMDIVMKSIFFKDYVVGEIRTVFVNNGVKDDRDSIDSTVNLENSIASVTSWGKELAIIQDMLTISGDTFDSKVNGKTNVEIMFDNIENSELLKNTRANLLIKAIDLVNIQDVEVPSDVTVQTLSDNNYNQYDKEIGVFISFAENVDAVDNLTDITNLTGDDKNSIADVLDSMKESKILELKYVTTLDTALNGIRTNQDLVNYGVSFKTKEQTNNYKDIVWADEIDNLTTISDNINTVSKYDETSIDTAAERTVTVAIIGETLDAVSNSAFLGEDQADKIADSVIKALTNNVVTNITKDANKTWTQAFTDALEAIPTL